MVVVILVGLRLPLLPLAHWPWSAYIAEAIKVPIDVVMYDDVPIDVVMYLQAGPVISGGATRQRVVWICVRSIDGQQ